MKKPLIAMTLATLFAGAAGPVFAGHDGNLAHHSPVQIHLHVTGDRDRHPRFDDHRPAYGKVVAVRPIVTLVKVARPREECWSEEVVHRRGERQSAVPTVIGGVVGGIIGHEIGSGRNRDVTTVAGAVLGAAVGSDIGRQQGGGRAVVTTREQCRVVQDYRHEERVEGYWVTYRYRGEKYTTRMDHDPGDTIRLRVAYR